MGYGWCRMGYLDLRGSGLFVVCLSAQGTATPFRGIPLRFPIKEALCLAYRAFGYACRFAEQFLCGD